MRAAFVFPGQGSQRVGMGRDLSDNFSEARGVFAEASEALGYDMQALCFNGPKEELDKTFRTQPSILTSSIAVYRALTARGISPVAVAGHSLGEYSAITAAGVLSLSDAVKLTEKRGIFMQEAVPQGTGLMAAILGLERKKVDDICLSVGSGYVAAANYNCPGQVVIAGEKQAVEDAMRLATEAGAKRALALAVSAPSHCKLMAEASDRLSEMLNTLALSKPSVPVMNNADALFLDNVESIKISLLKQLNSPLLWEDSIRNMAASGIDTFIEVGPGKVLSGLIKRIVPEAKIFNVEDTESLNRTAGALSLH